MKKRHVLIFAIFILPLPVLANTPEYCKPTFDEGAKEHFASSLNEAKDALSGICHSLSDGGVTQSDLHNTLSAFHQKIQNEASQKMPQLSKYLSIFDNPLLEFKGDVATGMIPEYIPIKPDPFDPNLVDKITLYYQGKGNRVYQDVPKAEAQSCFDHDDCRNALVAYMGILKRVYNPLSAQPLKLTAEFLTIKDKEWAAFIEEARGQTFLDITVTSWLYEWKYEKSEHDFRSPPRVQWFALRPNVLIENVSDAIDGEQIKESPALEVIGFNYWKDACFGYACGASLIVNYADRDGIEDKGWGLMLHVDNSYSFGFTERGGETGFFVTLDLLKLFQDKKGSFEDYKEKYRSLSN